MTKTLLFNFGTFQRNNYFRTQQQQPSSRNLCSTTLFFSQWPRHHRTTQQQQLNNNNPAQYKKMASDQQHHHHQVSNVSTQIPDVNPNYNARDARLVSSEWLRDNLQDVIVLDVRGRVEKVGRITDCGFQEVQYIANESEFLDDGHIPNARFVDWREIKFGTDEEIEEFCEDVLSPCGLYNNGETRIVVYDWGDMLFSARLWLALKIVGCVNVALLDGGWRSWNNMKDSPVSYDTECPLKLHCDFKASPALAVMDAHVLKASVGLKEMREIVDRNTSTSPSSSLDNNNNNSSSNQTGRTLIVDARSMKQYCGVERRNMRSGHIPTAVNLPYRQLINDDGIGLRDDEDIKQKLTRLVNNNATSGLQTTRATEVCEIVCYCNGGVASSLVYFCLVRHGFDEMTTIRNYCASFNEWGNLPELGVET